MQRDLIIVSFVLIIGCAGFDNAVQGCCGTGLFEAGYFCSFSTSMLCGNANEYVFFDAIHPTEKMYRLLADTVINTTLHVFMWNYMIFLMEKRHGRSMAMAMYSIMHRHPTPPHTTLNGETNIIYNYRGTCAINDRSMLWWCKNLRVKIGGSGPAVWTWHLWIHSWKLNTMWAHSYICTMTKIRICWSLMLHT